MPGLEPQRMFFVLIALTVATAVVGTARGAAAATRPSYVRPVWTESQSAAYTITVDETRESEDATLGRPSRLSMKRTLHLSLQGGPIDRDGLRLILCRFDRIELTGVCDGRELGYDSQRDKSGHGNACADLLENLVSPSLKGFEIRATPGGAFVEVRGLDSMWRDRHLLVAPAAVVSIQLLFRDQAMLRLLEDSLSPPLPAELATTGADSSAYDVTLPAEIPLVTPLTWKASFHVLGRERVGGQSCVRLRGNGPLLARRLPDDPATAGLLATVENGIRRADMHLDDGTGHVIRQNISQDIVLSLQLKAPAGGDSPRMMLRQSQTITVTRN